MLVEQAEARRQLAAAQQEHRRLTAEQSRAATAADLVRLDGELRVAAAEIEKWSRVSSHLDAAVAHGQAVALLDLDAQSQAQFSFVAAKLTRQRQEALTTLAQQIGEQLDAVLAIDMAAHLLQQGNHDGRARECLAGFLTTPSYSMAAAI